jgi:hypothetical protein
MEIVSGQEVSPDWLSGVLNQVQLGELSDGTDKIYRNTPNDRHKAVSEHFSKSLMIF